MSRRNLLIASLILFLNFILKFLFINKTPIGGDEPFTLFFAQADWQTIFEMLPTENNPPLHLFLMKIWVSFFGIEAISARFLSVVFSSFTALFIFIIGRKFFSEISGIISAFLFTFSSYAFHLSHDARPYALLMLLTALIMLIFLEITQNGKSKLWWLLALLNSLIIYTHFVGFFVLFAQLIVWLIHFRSIGNLKIKILFSWIIPAITYIPYLPIFLQRLTESKGGNWLEAPKIEGLYNMIWAFSNEPVNTVLLLLILTVGAILFVTRKVKFEFKHTFLFSSFFVIYLLMFVISQKVPMFLDRYLAHVSIPFYVLIGATVPFIFKNFLKSILGLLIIGLMVITIKFTSERVIPEDQIALQLSNEIDDNTGILLVPNWYFRTFAYHFDRSIFKKYEETETLLIQKGIFPTAMANNEFKQFIQQKKRLILVDTGSGFLRDFPSILLEINELGYQFDSENLEFEPYKIQYFTRN